MQITNQNPPLVPSSDTNAGADAAAPRHDSTAAASSPPPASSSLPVALVPSFEFLSLTATVQHIPPLRADVIAETVRRLANGDLRTPAAAEQTARAILGI